MSRRLLLWLLGALLITGLLSGGITYFLIRDNADGLLHRELRQVALVVGPLIDASATATQHPSFNSKVSPLAIQVSGLDGTVRYRSQNGPEIPASLPEGFQHLKVGKQVWHVYTHREPFRIVQVAQCSAPERDLSEQAGLSATVPILLLIPILGVLIVYLVRRSFGPVRRVLIAAAHRNASDLSPLPLAGVPQEVLPLVCAINRLFSRLETALSAQRQFVADAAHALRTPLAALQIELNNVRTANSVATQRERLDQLESMNRRASHLVTQLLRMARHEGGASGQKLQRVELDQLVKACLADHLPLADKRRIDLGMIQDDPGILLGDSEALRILLDNLIDNAVRYTPADGVVDVAVRTHASQVLLEVSDNGPGIPAAMHERVFDRFYRIEGSGTEGSGLGLSIVRSIADRHGASVRISNRPAGGTVVRVEFPSLSAQVG